MSYLLTKNEKKDLQSIENRAYMLPTLKQIQKFVSQKKNRTRAWKEVFNKLYEFLINAKDDVEILLEKRKKKGEIKDIRQSMKSIAGNAFSNALMYTFLQNKIVGNIRPDIFITSKKSRIKNFDQIATINIDDETQKPDMDLIIYTLKDDDSIDNCIILSLKTSLRERAGQTYKWKLLLEIATSPNSIKEKYNISYKSEKLPLICFATVNFYNEINNPQHRGMFKFFDKSFIAKPVSQKFISPLSELIYFANTTL